MPVTARRGFLIAEALCALALAGLLAVACASVLLQGRRLLDRAETRARAERGGREALHVAAAIARDADSIIVLGDSAIELQMRVGDGVACAREGTALYLPPQSGGGAALVRLAQPIEVGDEVRAWVEDSLTGYRAWVAALVDSATTRTGDAPCGSAGGFATAAQAGAARARLVIPALDARVGPGTPLRIGRRGRLSIYNAGGGDWMLGWRRCANGACGVIQPVAGPLRSRSAGGFQVNAIGGGRLEFLVGVPAIPGQLRALVVRTDAGR